jgi:TonB family protein
MLESKTFLSRAARWLTPSQPEAGQEPKQRRLMLLALSLLLAALVAVLYHDRDFWFPDADEAENQFQQNVDAPQPTAAAPETHPALRRKSPSSAKPRLNASSQREPSPPAMAVTSRTVLPPLEVEVVAGDRHQTVRPRNSEVKVDLDSESPKQDSDAFSQPASADFTTNAAERVEMSTDTSQLVSSSVQPGYPLLARQMKVEGSVILLAMIGRDGTVQDLRILSGPPILATAAREAVRQWRFKPHYEGSQPVETLAKVTVNFTISTN